MFFCLFFAFEATLPPTKTLLESSHVEPAVLVLRERSIPLRSLTELGHVILPCHKKKLEFPAAVSRNSLTI